MIKATTMYVRLSTGSTYKIVEHIPNWMTFRIALNYLEDENPGWRVKAPLSGHLLKNKYDS